MNGAANLVPADIDKAKVLNAHSALVFANKFSQAFAPVKAVEELPAVEKNWAMCLLRIPHETLWECWEIWLMTLWSCFQAFLKDFEDQAMSQWPKADVLPIFTKGWKNNQRIFWPVNLTSGTGEII